MFLLFADADVMENQKHDEAWHVSLNLFMSHYTHTKTHATIM